MNIPEELHYWYISLLLSCNCFPSLTQCILNVTWYMCCVIKLKQVDEHLLYILFCASARKPNFTLLHLININTSFCWCDAFIIGFWMCFILWHVPFLRQYSPYPAPLTLSFAYVSTSLKVMWYGWVLIACFYYSCFLLQVQVHKSIQWYHKSGSCV